MTAGWRSAAICCPQTDRFCAAVDKVGLCGLGQLAVLKVLAVFVQHQQFCNDPAADLAHDEHIQPAVIRLSFWIWTLSWPVGQCPST